MKIRIQQNEIRIRIDHAEVERLLDDNPISLSAPICANQNLQVILQTTTDQSFKTDFSGAEIRVQIPYANVLIWKDNRLATFTYEITDPSGDSGIILFEVDLKRESHKQ
jgi:hypothetical protein